jgi:hypothetical protein
MGDFTSGSVFLIEVGGEVTGAVDNLRQTTPPTH